MSKKKWLPEFPDFSKSEKEYDKQHDSFQNFQLTMLFLVMGLLILGLLAAFVSR